MNQATLLLNTGIPVDVSSRDLGHGYTRIGLMQSASTMRAARPTMIQDRAVAVLRVVQSLDARDTLDQAKLETVREAVERYYQVVRAAVADTLRGEETDLAAAYQCIGKEARNEVERMLAAGFRRDGAIRRVATQIIRACP